MMSRANEDPLRYLTEPLHQVAQRHLPPEETLLTAIYIQHTVYHVPERWLGFTFEKLVELPARAFLLTTERAVILEDPTDRATSTIDREYLVASCSLNRIMFFELRSHLLDCALTLIIATSNGPERVTIEYSGVSERAFLGAVAGIRALIDHLPLPSSMRPDETYARERAAAQVGWHAVLDGLGIRLENAVTRYLVAGEHVQEYVAVPTIDESAWWQRFGLGAYEQPPAVLVRTERQILLVKEVKRIVRGVTSYGSDAWLIPKAHLQTATIVSGRREPELQLTLEHLGATETLRVPVLPEQAERAVTLVLSHVSSRG
jgi:hypothetical protein